MMINLEKVTMESQESSALLKEKILEFEIKKEKDQEAYQILSKEFQSFQNEANRKLGDTEIELQTEKKLRMELAMQKTSLQEDIRKYKVKNGGYRIIFLIRN